MDPRNILSTNRRFPLLPTTTTPPASQFSVQGREDRFQSLWGWSQDQAALLMTSDVHYTKREHNHARD
jgi:hypothetical protein